MQWFKIWWSDRSQTWLRYGLLAVVMAVVIVGFGRSSALAVTPRHYTELDLPPAPEIQLPEYTRVELDNGMNVYLLEDHELPLVYGNSMIYTGGRLEPADQVGLASITGEVMRSGGTQAHPADVLNQILEQRAASVETGIDTTSGFASFSTLSEDLPEVFGLFAEVLRQPAFPQDKLDLSKSQWQGSIARRNDDPSGIAGREFQKLIYGADSPYARTVEYITLDNITRDDLMNFYQQSFQPQNILLGIVGDFETEAMKSLIEAQFGDWQPDPNAKAENADSLPAVSQAKVGGIFFVDQPQLTQSSVQIGHLGDRFDRPDYAAMSVLNEVMNGLGGRLVNNVRSRQGLAYSIYAFWSPRFDYPGLFIGGGQTQSETTVPFVQSTLAEIEQIRTTPITEAELIRAKDSVLNAFIFNFQTPFQILSRVMRYDYYGYPQDFIFQYQQKVAETTVEEVQRAAEENLKPENIVTLVVGNAAAIDPPLSTLSPDAEVTQIDITISPPRG
ncbi:MAG: insulinase family protein [Cyanobacteria bacterium CRU_2_1]|nr:insulinase family protein [Cyanobacteria bacterium CRU_2_1]